jgi:hypothetical protein
MLLDNFENIRSLVPWWAAGKAVVRTSLQVLKLKKQHRANYIKDKIPQDLVTVSCLLVEALWTKVDAYNEGHREWYSLDEDEEEGVSTASLIYLVVFELALITEFLVELEKKKRFEGLKDRRFSPMASHT